MIHGKKLGIDARMIEMSGIGTYIQHIIGHGFYDYAIGNENKIRKYAPNIKVIHFDAPIYKAKEQILFPNKQIKSAGIELMHFPHYNVPVSYQGDYVVTIHDLIYLVFPKFIDSKIKYYYSKFLMYQAIKRACHIFTDSKNSQNDIIRFFGTPKDKISITYIGVDEEFRIKEKSEIEYLYQKYGISKESKIILYVGNLKPHKNIETLLKAIACMDQHDKKLILAGKAFNNVNLEVQEEKLGITGSVIHTGLIGKEELIDLYNLADVFVFPSLYEGFGLPPLEAMACGTPVIASDNSSIPEVLGDAALLVNGTDEREIADSISILLNNTDVYKKYRMKGMAKAKEYSWNSTNKVTKEMISQILTESRTQ